MIVDFYNNSEADIHVCLSQSFKRIEPLFNLRFRNKVPTYNIHLFQLYQRIGNLFEAGLIMFTDQLV